MVRVLVTGGAGFIGTELCRALLNDGHHVTVLDVTKSPLEGVRTVICDITDSQLREGSIWKDIDVCYHLAAMANVNDCRFFRDKAFEVNLYGTFNIAEACRKNNILMIFASTACVYGNTPQHPSSEDGPTKPCDLYGVTKRAGEEIVKNLPKWLILRFGTTVGPRMRHALATWIFLNQAHNGEPFTITGNGMQSRNWIYIDDLVRGCVLTLKRHIKNEIINLVGKKSYTVNEMARLCNEIVNGKRAPFIVRYIPPREGDVFKEDISIEKAKKILGWEPKINLRKALELSYRRGFLNGERRKR